MRRWLQHFDLTAPPFDKDLDAENLWMPSSRRQTLSAMKETLAERGHILLVGEPDRHIVWGLTFRIVESFFVAVGQPLPPHPTRASR